MGRRCFPGGKAVLFTLASSATQSQSNPSTDSFWNDAQIVVQSLDSGQKKVVAQGGADARYVPTGHLVYVRQGTLFAVPFDPERLETTGIPFPVADGVRQAIDGAIGGSRPVQFPLTPVQLTSPYLTTGCLHTFHKTPPPQAHGHWSGSIARDAKHRFPFPIANVYPRISPDGTRVALDIRDQEQDVWVWDLSRETLTRITFDPATDISPVWTPDGQRIVFSRASQGLFWQTADGTGEIERLIESTTNPLPAAFSQDGMQLVFHEGTSPQTVHIQTLSVKDKATVDLLAQAMVQLRNGSLSPDGRWLAYQSDESGQFEIYVGPSPMCRAGDGRFREPAAVVRPGPRNGRELFYLAPPAQTASGGASEVAVMAVAIETGSGFRAGNPARLFAGQYFAGLLGRTYDVSPDGQRFLMIKDKTTSASSANRIVIVENFFEELKRRAPAR